MNQKNSHITVRCTEKQKNMIDKGAKKSGMSTSEYVLKKALNGTGRLRSTKEDMAICNARFQVKLNELIRLVMETQNQQLVEKVKEIQEAEDMRWKL